MVTVAKLLKIPIGRGCALMLYPSELRQGLAEEYWEMGLKRGKAIQRRRTFGRREKQRMCQKLSRNARVKKV